ncbi:MAG: hypothetical protein JWN03_4154 [Nocardia sp.]|nr:hypothetical protein [Nocardia sp.]
MVFRRAAGLGPLSRNFRDGLCRCGFRRGRRLFRCRVGRCSLWAGRGWLRLCWCRWIGRGSGGCSRAVRLPLRSVRLIVSGGGMRRWGLAKPQVAPPRRHRLRRWRRSLGLALVRWVVSLPRLRRRRLAKPQVAPWRIRRLRQLRRLRGVPPQGCTIPAAHRCGRTLSDRSGTTLGGKTAAHLPCLRLPTLSRRCGKTLSSRGYGVVGALRGCAGCGGIRVGMHRCRGCGGALWHWDCWASGLFGLRRGCLCCV